jgi:micrococcal nuclease
MTGWAVDVLNSLSASGIGITTNQGVAAKAGTNSITNNYAKFHDWKSNFDSAMYPVFYSGTTSQVPDMYAIRWTGRVNGVDDEGYTLTFTPGVTFIDQRILTERGITATIAEQNYQKLLALDTEAKNAETSRISAINRAPLLASDYNNQYTIERGDANKKNIEMPRLSVSGTVGAVVTRVVDGDTFDVTLDNGQRLKIRVLGVDTPETNLGKNKPSRFNGKSKTFLYYQAKNAKYFAIATLQGKRVKLQLDAANQGIDGYGRTLAYLFYGPNGEYDYTDTLIVNGYARVSQYKVSRTADYLTRQEYAKEHCLGIWSGAGAPMADGNQTTSEKTKIIEQAVDLTADYVIRNISVYIGAKPLV